MQDSSNKEKTTPKSGESLKAKVEEAKAAEKAAKDAAQKSEEADEPKKGKAEKKPKKYVVCSVERTRYNQTTGKKESRERIRHIPEKQFKSFKEYAEKTLGYNVKVIS